MNSAVDRCGRVDVHPFEIEKDRVTFRWSSDVPLPAQRRNALTFRYEGLDLGAFAPELFAEIFLAMQLRVFKRVSGAVQLTMPLPVPETTAEFWRTYHSARNVTIVPLRKSPTYETWNSTSRPERRQYPVAVYFGGGRDSLSTACILGEIYGRENVLLVAFINPAPGGSGVALSNRFERLMLEPARSLGFPVQRIWTDLIANVRPLPNDRALPHLEQFTAAALPVLLAHRVSVGAFCLAWTDYWTLTDSSGSVRYFNSRSRPGWLRMQSRHYQRTLDFSHTVSDLNLALTPPISVRVLADRYPEAMAGILMCHHPKDPAQRWCHNCRKCFGWLQMCLAEGAAEPDFDFDRMLAHSPWLQEILVRSGEIDTVQPDGNLPWRPWLHAPDYHAGFTRLMWKSDPSLLAGRVSPDAAINLMLMQMFYGNNPVAEVDCIPQIAVDTLPEELRIAFMGIVGRYAKVVPEFDHVIEVGGNHLTFDLQPTKNPLMRLAHLQD